MTYQVGSNPKIYQIREILMSSGLSGGNAQSFAILKLTNPIKVRLNHLITNGHGKTFSQQREGK